MHICPEDNGYEVEQEDANPFEFVARDEGAPPDLVRERCHVMCSNSLLDLFNAFPIIVSGVYPQQ